ncbi:MAG TPA: alpha/beta fold hydrolase [Acidimicrobiales bacterium]|nr:alpha/beta fold hydrolase [Acidimicrobiales bacterium]
MKRSVRLFTVAVPVLVAASGFGLAPSARATTGCTDTSPEAFSLDLTVDGEAAHGLYALPTDAPKGIVAFDHGYGHTSESWRHHLVRIAEELDVIAIAMDYRGLQISPPATAGGLPTSRGWNVAKGAADTIAATQQLEVECPDADLIVVHGVSMGGNTSGLVAAAGAKRSDAETPLFDYWVNIEGATNVTETYAAATAAAPADTTAANAKVDIEAEMGGTLLANPDEYRRHSVVTRAADIKAGGLKGVVMVHGVDDGLVPPNQTREMGSMLTQAGVPYELFTVVRRTAESEQDTTITGHAVGRVKKDYVSPFAGHASEKSTTNVVMVKGFERLAALFAGSAPCGVREHVVDASTTTQVASTC